eukprot:jgi/Chlat1/3481/Chrsp23S03671
MTLQRMGAGLLLAGVLLQLFAAFGSSETVACTLNVDTQLSIINYTIVIPSLRSQGTQEVPVKGAVEAFLDDPFGDAPGIRFKHAGLAADGLDLDVDLGVVFGVATGRNLRASQQCVTHGGSANERTMEFNLEGFILALDNGTIALSGTRVVGYIIDNKTIELSTDPFIFPLERNKSTLKISQSTTNGTPVYKVSMTVPVKSSDKFADIPLTTLLQLSGVIYFQATCPVPALGLHAVY